MYRSLYFKIILIFVVFIITVMAVVGTVLLNSVFRYYNKEFVTQMEEYLSPDAALRSELEAGLDGADFAESQKQILSAWSTKLGIDIYRNFYILDESGDYLSGSQSEPDGGLPVTENLISAMAGTDGKNQIVGAEFTDYAIKLSSGGQTDIIYIKDTQDEMRELSGQLFLIILQSVMIGLIIAVILSFFLAKAITQPIQNLTHGAQMIAAGEFSERLDVESKDEIGILTATFNRMKNILKNTLAEVDGERSKLETIFAYLKDGVIAFSENGSVLQINKSATDLFGEAYDKATFNYEHMMSLFYFEFAQAFTGDDEDEHSYILRDVGLGERTLDVNVGTLRYIDNNENREGMIIVLHDITERYELDKSRREFVANVSHELRTPLTYIHGAMEAILTYPDMDDVDRTEFLTKGIEESDRMLRILGDLLTLSRLDNKRTQWKIGTFDLRRTLEHICDTLGLQAREKNQTITLHGKSPLPELTADKDRIEQVVINIITNSIKYTPEGGAIEVYAFKNNEPATDGVEGESVSIVVRDNGIGIPAEDMPRLFERFYRVEKSRTSETGGTGLGLSIAKEITEAHGGKIILTSEQNKGTTVKIVLPVKTKLENS